MTTDGKCGDIRCSIPKPNEVSFTVDYRFQERSYFYIPFLDETRTKLLGYIKEWYNDKNELVRSIKVTY